MNRLKTIDIQVNRLINATPEQVYATWLDKTSPGSPWFGVPKVILDPPIIDGLFYTMYAVEGREFAHYGRFVSLDPPHQIQYTWVSEATQGLETLLTVTFIAREGKTEVQVLHTDVPDDEGGLRHKQAWGFVLSRMTKFFSPQQLDTST